LRSRAADAWLAGPGRGGLTDRTLWRAGWAGAHPQAHWNRWGGLVCRRTGLVRAGL